jgi:hypothetical protein
MNFNESELDLNQEQHKSMLLDRPGSNSNQSFLQGGIANRKNTSMDRSATGRMARPKSKQ